MDGERGRSDGVVARVAVLEATYRELRVALNKQDNTQDTILRELRELSQTVRDLTLERRADNQRVSDMSSKLEGVSSKVDKLLERDRTIDAFGKIGALVLGVLASVGAFVSLVWANRYAIVEFFRRLW